MAATLQTCAVEVGLFRKKPCGHASVAQCSNCEQPLCGEHAVPLLTDNGKRSGKFSCQECSAALKEQEKSLAAVARSQGEKKKAALDGANAPKKPVAPAPAAAPVAPDPKTGDAGKKEPDALEFTPKDGNLSYTPRKKDDEGHKP